MHFSESFLRSIHLLWKKVLFWMVVLFLFIAMNPCGCRFIAKETITLPESSNHQDIDISKGDLEDEKSLSTTTGGWEITLTDKEVLSPTVRFHFLLGKVENGKVKCIEKKSWDKAEKTFLEYDNHTPSHHLLALSISPNGQLLAYDGRDGLLVYDRTKGTKTVLERTSFDKNISSKYTSYIKKISWSPDNHYLLLQYVAHEATAVFLYDLKQNRKFSPSGDGLLSGSDLLWVPGKNTFLDPSSDAAYGDPGLYQSDSKNIEKYSDISVLFGMQNRLFYQAAFHPDGNQVALITSPEPTENQRDFSHSRSVCLINLRTKQVIDIDQGVLIESLFFSPDGNRLYYFARNEGSSPTTCILTYDLILQDSRIEGCFKTDKLDIREAKWINAHSVLLELVQWNEDHSFKHTQIVGLDVTQKKFLYSSQAFPFESKLLAILPYD